MSQARALWKIPAMWLVVGLPLLSIVAGVGLVVLALRGGSVDAVPDRVQRVSQIQTTDLAPDGQARRMGLSAVARIEDGVVEVIPVGAGFLRTEPLRLTLVHPVQASRDLVLQLSPSPAGWRADRAEVSDAHDWILRLAPEDDGWRLHGRLAAGVHAARLAPSLPGQGE